MFALTLKHPWPCAVARWGKDIENRTWAPYSSQLSPGDWFAIHGGAEPRGKVRREAEVDLRYLRMRKLAPRDIPLEDATLTGIVAVCRFDGTVRNSESPWFHGPSGWVLGRTVALPEPVPCKGAQGLWTLPEEVLARVRQRYRLATGGKDHA